MSRQKPEQLTQDQKDAAQRLLDRLRERGVRDRRIVPVMDANGTITGWQHRSSLESSTVRHR